MADFLSAVHRATRSPELSAPRGIDRQGSRAPAPLQRITSAVTKGIPKATSARGFAPVTEDRVEALIAFPDSVIFGQRDNIVQSALRSSLPGVYLYREWVAAGGLLAYEPNQASILGGPLPAMVDKILKGARPGDLPVEHGKLELFANRGTARAMRIDLPQSLLSRADEVLG